ncbi:hypothetical protein [Cobetia crustatorum]|nr:hypothetical protein [Cobetia crustatorum]
MAIADTYYVLHRNTTASGTHFVLPREINDNAPRLITASTSVAA